MEISSFAQSEIPKNSTVFTLSTSSDLKILITESIEAYPHQDNDPSDAEEVSQDCPARFNSPHAPIIRTAIFYVKKSALAENNVLPTDLGWKGEVQNDTISLTMDSIRGMGVWLATFHGQFTPHPTMSIEDIWDAIKVCVEYDFDRTKLKPWFADWVDRIRDEQPVKWSDAMFNRQLLFPCHFFDDAEGFKHLTRCLVYNTNMFSQIKESKPILFNRGHLTPRFVIQQLNAVREKLRTTLQGHVSAEVDRNLQQNPCDCNETSICVYLKELNRIGIRPWGDTFYKSSIKEITDRLELFDKAHIRKLNVKPCHCKFSPHCGCSISWDEVIKKARNETLEYFEGLCLDCMRRSPRKDSKYWRPESHQEDYDKHCRIYHGKTSWYFSFMGER